MEKRYGLFCMSRLSTLRATSASSSWDISRKVSIESSCAIWEGGAFAFARSEKLPVNGTEAVGCTGVCGCCWAAIISACRHQLKFAALFFRLDALFIARFCGFFCGGARAGAALISFCEFVFLRRRFFWLRAVCAQARVAARVAAFWLLGMEAGIEGWKRVLPARAAAVWVAAVKMLALAGLARSP